MGTEGEAARVKERLGRRTCILNHMVPHAVDAQRVRDMTTMDATLGPRSAGNIEVLLAPPERR